jgi:DNA-binding NtrC family response regulator
MPSVLVVDEVNGPADILMNTIGMLVDGVNVMTIPDCEKAVRALKQREFDLVVVGMCSERGGKLAVLPRLQSRHPQKSVIVISDYVNRSLEQDVHRLGAEDVYALPHRAADLRQLTGRIMTLYLS